MKAKLLFFMTMLLPLSVLSRTDETAAMAGLPAEGEAQAAMTLEQAEAEDTTRFRSVDDVVKDMTKRAKIEDTSEHRNEVWSRRSYFNLGYNISTLAPKNDYRTGVGDELVQDFKSNYGFSLQYGRSFRLLKKPPFWNILGLYIDYTGIDLNFNHYESGPKGDGTSQNLYDSRMRNEDAMSGGHGHHGGNTPYYIPWNLEKFELSYGMMVGPSFTVAPFTHITNTKGLHFMKFNGYFHIGYQASILNMKSNMAADINDPDKIDDAIAYDQSQVDDLLKLNWGHGLLMSFGFSLTWKSIGFGYEHRIAHNKYMPVKSGDDEFGGGSYRFKTATNRIYLSFRMGR